MEVDEVEEDGGQTPDSNEDREPGTDDIIKEINSIELTIVALLRVASQATSMLTSTAPTKDPLSGLAFDDLAKRYFDALNVIQNRLRVVIRLLADKGVLARPDQHPMPIKTNVHGEEKDLELLVEAVDLLRSKMKDALDQHTARGGGGAGASES
ncbi:hypothetical protein SmJEL517_g05279 [Synchytrium microbalum]|uniref:Mediator of RNA polymerase II transcription subunit 11 n=1 Tax=Synchytrium microbalum TaxID=1806994 RepID=A0A507C1I1_9FUNG|nr:uncharacterized protein SmJEL517_g05279 [Synchytrium microbalum]TPX31363.1 hypothetical protein SmJEL517_g05279 [Synchytrium microbalum]